MKNKTIIALLLSFTCFNIFAQEKQVFRGGLGLTMYNPGPYETSLRVAPSMYLEYGYRFNDYLSATANFSNTHATHVEYSSDTRYDLSFRAYVKPFAKKSFLKRFELGLGLTGEYREISSWNRSHRFEPGIDIPFRFNLISKNNYELTSFFDLNTRFDKQNGFDLYYYGGGLLFGVKF